MVTSQDLKCLAFLLGLRLTLRWWPTLALLVATDRLDSSLFHLLTLCLSSGMTCGALVARFYTTSGEHPEFSQALSWQIAPPTPLDCYLSREGPLTMPVTTSIQPRQQLLSLLEDRRQE